VLTAVAALLDLTKPDVAVFGEKDAQQLELIKRMVAKQRIPVEVLGVEVVREPDGLALSSRNRYLDSTDREAALALSKALMAGARAAPGGARAAVAEARRVLAENPEVHIDYLTVIDDNTWLEPDDRTRQARILVSGRVGSTHLIDNVSVDLGTEHQPGHATG
jgi:pantoate--beta-alanine ligase